MKNDRKVEYIVCPNCGREYLPAEIYYPDKFLGKPSDIEKCCNKIEGFTGRSMDCEETYICDSCENKFRVVATVKFKVSSVPKYDMSRAYVTPLFEDKITMYEGD